MTLVVAAALAAEVEVLEAAVVAEEGELILTLTALMMRTSMPRGGGISVSRQMLCLLATNCVSSSATSALVSSVGCMRAVGRVGRLSQRPLT